MKGIGPWITIVALIVWCLGCGHEIQWLHLKDKARVPSQGRKTVSLFDELLN